ncbi:MAG: hypothetical protein ACM32E_12550 [Gemmatimonadota bacterium]
MSSVSESGGRSSGKTIIAVVLGVVALVLIILGVMYFIEPAKNLLIGSVTTGPQAEKHRPLWGAASLVVAVICLIGAWFTLKGGKSSSSASPSEPAATASK